MSNWETRLSESPLVADLNKTRDALTNLSPPPTYPDESEPIDRCLYCVDQILLQLVSADRRAISENTLGMLEQQSAELSSHASYFRESRDQGHLKPLTGNVNSLLALSSQLPPLPWGEAKDVVQKSVETLRDSSDKLRSQVRVFSTRWNTQVGEIQKKLAMASQDGERTIESLKAAADQRISELQRSTADQTHQFEQTTTRMQTQINANIQRIDSSISALNDRYITFQENQAQQFSESQNLRQTAFDELVKKQNQQSTNTNDALQTAGQDLINYLSETAENAASILGVTAASVTSEAYLNEAKEQKNQANFWRWIGIGSLLGTIIVGVSTLLWLNPETGSSTSRVVSFYVGRTAIVGAVVALAGFAIRESGQHRSRERENKRLANQLSTFRPFLSELDEEDRNRLVQEASSRYFPGYGADGLSSSSEAHKSQPLHSEEALESDEG